MCGGPMAIFDWPFGQKARGVPPTRGPAAGAVKAPTATSRRGAAMGIRDLGSKMLTIPALDFFGLYERSPNGRFRVAWRDGDGNRGGARQDGLGHYVLIDQDRVVARGRMERPNDGKVADNGNFILN